MIGMEGMNGDQHLLRNILSQMVSKQLKQYIIDNRMKPGDQLPTERDLAIQLGVSRTVVREALNQLETLGLIVKVQGKGIFIAEQNLNAFFEQIITFWQLNQMDLAQLLEFRLLLEQAAFEQIIAHAEESDFSRLNQIINDSEDPTLSKENFFRLDFEFHHALLKLAQNELYQQLTSVVHHYFNMIELKVLADADVNQRRQTIADHRKLVQLLSDKKIAEAKLLMRRHLLQDSPLTHELEAIGSQLS